MSNFNIIRVESDIIYLKIKKTFYYIDMHDIADVRVYDSDFKRLCVFVPEYWIIEVSGGTITLPALNCAMQAYQVGYSDASRHAFSNGMKNFIHKLVNVIFNVKEASEFIKLCWIELHPYSSVKNAIVKLLSDRKLCVSDLLLTNMMISRFEIRAKSRNDKEIIDKIELVRLEHDLTSIEFDAYSVFANFFVNDSVDEISSNIAQIKNRRNGITNRE